jgi:hypothetical protein
MAVATDGAQKQAHVALRQQLGWLALHGRSPIIGVWWYGARKSSAARRSVRSHNTL